MFDYFLLLPVFYSGPGNVSSYTQGKFKTFQHRCRAVSGRGTRGAEEAQATKNFLDAICYL